MKFTSDVPALTPLADGTSDVFYAQIVEHIRMWILSGHLKENDVLPSERELAQMFGVSRMPVSQALKILEFLGVIQKVRGKGICVKKIDVHKLLNNIGFLILDPQRGLEDLFEVRQAIEVKAAKLASKRRTQEDLDAMEDALLEMERNILMEKSVRNASIRFHTSLINATHNDVLIKVNDFLMELLRYSRKMSLKEVTIQDRALKCHLRIFHEIKMQNEIAAGEAMEEHLLELSVLVKSEQ
jgi:GntR family transcriptional repressor for pyruvate dehydrogenase complex